MPLYNTDTTPTIYRGMKRVMKRCWTVSHKPPSSREPRVSLHNNLQFAHQLRVLTNYGDINRGGVMAEGVCPKTQDTRGMSTLVSCNSWRSVSFAPRDFPAFLPLRRVFPRSEIFVCLRSIFHIVDVPPTIQQFRITNSTYFQLVLDRLFSVYSILSRKSPVYKSLIQQFLLGRTERWKKKEKVRKMQDRDGSRKRRLIWSEECREIREIFKQFHGPVNLTRCFPSSFFFFFGWIRSKNTGIAVERVSRG